jgi:hypothetical protein
MERQKIVRLLVQEILVGEDTITIRHSIPCARPFPALVLPTHWDNFTASYGGSQQPAIDAVQSFVQEVTAASPNSKVIVPKYFEPISLDLPSR